MMSLVIDRFVEVLATQPDALLPASAMGARRPASGADIPTVAISLSVDAIKGTGLGRYIRAADRIVQSSSTVVAAESPETFMFGLRRLRISPLALRKSPSSTSAGFSGEDLQIRNVTQPSAPVVYRMTDRPVQQSEFRLDVDVAEVVFGSGQTPGATLEVIYWTVAWRDEISGDRYAGTMLVEMFASSAAAVGELSRRVQARIQTQPDLARRKGFMKLQPAGLDPAESVVIVATAGSPFALWKQGVRYRFVFEGEEGGEVSSGVPIKRIDLNVKRPEEAFSVPS